jgi:hypothetical protein
MPCDTVTVESGDEGGAVLSLESSFVSNSSPGPGDPATTMSADIYNAGDAEGTAEVEIAVGPWSARTTSKSIGPSGVVTIGADVDYATLLDNVGTGDAQVTFTLMGGNGWSKQTDTKTITVERQDGGGGEPDIVVSSISGPSGTPSPGDNVNIGVTLQNNGDSGGESDIPLSVNGDVSTYINRFVGRGEKVSLSVGITVPDEKTVTVAAGSASSTFSTTSGTGGDGNGEGGVISQIIGFARDNPYAVGAGALAAGYMAIQGDNMRVIPRYRANRINSQNRRTNLTDSRETNRGNR